MQTTPNAAATAATLLKSANSELEILNNTTEVQTQNVLDNLHALVTSSRDATISLPCWCRVDWIPRPLLSPEDFTATLGRKNKTALEKVKNLLIWNKNKKPSPPK